MGSHQQPLQTFNSFRVESEATNSKNTIQIIDLFKQKKKNKYFFIIFIIQSNYDI